MSETETAEDVVLQTYGKSKPPDEQKIRDAVMSILNNPVCGELQLFTATELRRRICNKVKAPSFYQLLRRMEQDELLMVDGVDQPGARCGTWNHPLVVEHRIEQARWMKEMEESDRQRAEERRQWEIENAPRLAAERFQKELGEFFVNNSGELFATVRRMFRIHGSKKIQWMHSRPLK
ncbi:MAG TPA: hypothetical protein V6D22_04545 [Candidatus Obscuribacterales bacterium]